MTAFTFAEPIVLAGEARNDPWGRYMMGVTAESVDERNQVWRAEQDAFAAQSQRRAAAAIARRADAGRHRRDRTQRGLRRAGHRG